MYCDVQLAVVGGDLRGSMFRFCCATAKYMAALMQGVPQGKSHVQLLVHMYMFNKICFVQ